MEDISAYSEGSADDYLSKSFNQVLLGNYTDDVTLLGTAGQVAVGLTGLDIVADTRDLYHDVTNWEWSWKHVGETALDLVGLIPVVGSLKVLKHVDEIGTLVKHSDEVADVVKSADEVVDAAGIKVYRVWGDGSKPWGQSWTTADPSTIDDYRSVAGLPAENSGRFVSEGILVDDTGVVLKKAVALEENQIGLPELVIPNSAEQVMLTRVSGVNPPYD